MMDVATNTTKKGKHLVRAAQYNIGRAYFQGYGCKQSYTVAERWDHTKQLDCYLAIQRYIE